MMRRVRRSAQFLIAVAVLAVGACSDEAPTAPTGGPPDPEAPPPTATNTPASATITSDGGTLQASGADGSSLRLTFPEGALVEPVAFTVTATDPGSARARYLIAPFGLTLLAPVTLELVLPEGIPLEGGRLAFIDGDDRTPMPITIDPATRTVRATTLDLGYSVGSAASADRAARFAGLAASPLATSHNTPTPLEYDEASCSLSMESLRIKRSQTQTYYTRYDPDFPEFGTEGILSAATMRGLHQTFIQALEDCGGDSEASFVEERDLLQGISCESYADARQVAGEFQPALGQGGTEDHWSILNLLLSWAEAIELTGAACSNPVPVEETMEPVWDRYLDDYAARLDRDGMDISHWRRAWAIDLTEAITLKATLQYYTLTSLDSKIDQEVLTRLFDLLRLGAFDRCREDGEQGYFVDVMNGGGVVAAYAWPGAPPPAPRPPPAEWRNFTLDAVKRDVQLCGTRIDVTVFDDVPEELVDQAAYLGRGNTLNSHEDEASINLPSGGALLLSGEIRPLRCLSRTATARWSNDDLVVRLEGHEVARRSHTNGDFLHIPLDLPLPDMLEAAGLPEDTSGELTLTLVREGEACEAQYGDPTTTIATIELDVDESGPSSFGGLGFLPGSTTIRPTGISGDGSVVVGYGRGGQRQAFRWEDGQMVGLGDLVEGMEISSEAHDASYDGSIIVGRGSQYASGVWNGPEAARWNTDGVIVGLGSPEAYGRSEAHGVSRDGSVVVGYAWPHPQEAPNTRQAVRWHNGNAEVLGVLDQDVGAEALDVSADGSIIVGNSYRSFPNGKTAFRWENGEMVGLGALPGHEWSEAKAVSANGSVIVGTSATGGRSDAFRWENGSMVALGEVYPHVGARASAVNADGSVIVGISHWPFIWTTDEGIRRLDEVLVEDHGLDLTGWELLSAVAISDNGRTIVGLGRNPDGVTEAWIARLHGRAHTP